MAADDKSADDIVREAEDITALPADDMIKKAKDKTLQRQTTDEDGYIKLNCVRRYSKEDCLGNSFVFFKFLCVCASTCVRVCVQV